MKKILIVIWLLALLVSSLNINANESAASYLKTDSPEYFIGDTVTLEISVPQEEYENYFLRIESSQKNFTYRGDFNQVMFFYPTEADVYTASLVDKSTGVEITVEFKVTVNSASLENNLVTSIIADQDESGISSSVIKRDDDREVVEPSETDLFTSDVSSNAGDKDYFFLEKQEFYSDELIRLIQRYPEVTSEFESLGIYYLHDDVAEKYAGSIGSVEFLPKGVGSQELVVVDSNGDLLKRYSFEVLMRESAEKSPKLISKNYNLIKIRDFYKKEDSVQGQFFDSKGKRVSESEFVNSKILRDGRKISLVIDRSISSITDIRLNDVSPDAFGEINLGLEDLPVSIIKKRGHEAKKAFVVDASKTIFTNGSFSSVAQGDELWKCKDWLFDERRCVGNWTKVMNLVRGETYSVEIAPEDPAFVEIIPISSALRLSGERATLEDISESVISLDGSYARVFDGEYVRVFFEQNLTAERDITIYAISNSSARIDVYIAGGSEVIATFENVSAFNKYQILLTNLDGFEDVFDLKISAGSGGWVDFDFIVDPIDLLPPSTREGMLVYGENGALNPRYRIWNGSGFGVEESANDVGGLPEWIALAASPIIDEYVLAVADDVDDINVQIYSYINSTTLCWHNGTSCSGVWEFDTASTAQNYNKVSVAYEQLSGYAMVVYVDASPAIDVARYRVWNGSDWSVETSVPQTLLTGNIESVRLAERPNSNELALVLSDANNDGNIMIWNGSAWNCQPTALPTINLFATAHPKTYDLAYEQVSGDLLVVFSDNTATEIVYTNKSADICSFTTRTTTTLGARGQIVSVGQQPASDYILVGLRGFTGDDSQGIVWDGIDMVNASVMEGTSFAEGAGNMIISAGWAGSNDTGIILYADATAANINATDYLIYNKTSTLWTGGVAGLHTTNLNWITNFSASDRGYQSISSIDQNMMMAIVQDDANDLWAKYFDRYLLRWFDADEGTPLETESIAGTLELPVFSFVWKLSTQAAPSINFVDPTDDSGIKYNRSYFQINVSAGDVNYQNMSVFVYNSSGSIVNVTNTTALVLFFNVTGLDEGIYFFNATACDSLNNCNSTETRNLTLSIDIPLINFSIPTDLSDSYISRSNILVNVTVVDSSIGRLNLSIFNSSGDLIYSNYSYASPFFLNVTSLLEGLYYFNATVFDLANNYALTETRNVAVDLFYPAVSFFQGTDISSGIVNRRYIQMNISANDTFQNNISANIYNLSGGQVAYFVSNASYYFYNATDLDDGIYYFNATACDYSGKCNFTETRNITIDSTAPEVYYDLPTEQSGAVLERAYIQVNATAFDLRFNNLTILLVNSTGSVINQSSTAESSLFLNQTVDEGIYYFNATACDSLGNCNITDTRSIIVDYFIPLIELVSPTDLSGGNDSRSYIQINVSADDYNFNNLSVRIYSSLGNLVLSQMSAQRIFFYNATGLVEDTYYFNATACDLAGRCNSTETRSFSLSDNDFPIVNFTAPTEISGSILDVGYAIVNVTASDASLKNITVFFYSISGDLFSLISTTQSGIYWNATGFNDGFFYFNATACDVSGKCSSTETRNITIDDAYGPTIIYSDPTDMSGQFYSRSHVIINVTSEDANLNNNSIYLFNESGSLVNYSTNTLSGLIVSTFVVFSDLVDGLYYFNSTTCDLSDNCIHAITRNITVDTTGPNVILNSPLDSQNIVDIASFNVSANISDVGVSMISQVFFEYKVNATESWTTACNTSGQSTVDCMWDLTGLEDGDAYELRVFANDTLGNVGQPDIAQNVTIDRLSPEITIFSPENESSVGSTNVLFRYAVYDAGSSISNCSLIWEGQINQTEQGPLAENQEYNFILQNVTNGNYSWSINCTDMFGHTSAKGVYNLTVDIKNILHLNVSSDKAVYEKGNFAGEPILIYTLATGFFGNGMSDVNITSDLVRVYNLTEPVVSWWNSSWNKRKPIFLSTNSTANILNARVVINVTGLDGNITNCSNELRIVDNVMGLLSMDVLSGDNSTYCEVAFLANITANATNENKYFAYYNNSASTVAVAANLINRKYPIFFENFEGAGWNVIASEDPTIQCAGGSGQFNGCLDFTGGMDFAVTTGSAAPVSGTRIMVWDQSTPFAANRGVFYNFSATSGCGGDLCDDILVTGYSATASVDSSGEFSRVWARSDSSTSYTTIYQCVGPAPACEFTGVDNTLPSLSSHYSFFSETLKESLGMTLTSTMFVHVAGVGSGTDDNFYFEDINITGLRKQAPNVTSAIVGSSQMWMGAQVDVTDLLGMSTMQFESFELPVGNYSVVSRGQKNNYSSAINKTYFELIQDISAPLIEVIMPAENEVIDPFLQSYVYTFNSSVQDVSSVNVFYYYRENPSSPWIYICNTSLSTEYSCSWNLAGLEPGSEYSILAYGVDYYGFLSGNVTVQNLTINSGHLVTMLSIYAEDNATLPINQIDLIAGGVRDVLCNVSVSEEDSYTNINSVNATFYHSSAAYNSLDDDKSHYSNASCDFISGSGLEANYICGFGIQYFAYNGTWYCRAEARNNYTSANISDNTTVNQLFAINISSSSIDYSSVEPEAESSDVAVNITNLGNVPINISVYGYGGDDEESGNNLAMVCSINNISVAFQKFSTTVVPYDSKISLSSTPIDVGLNIPPKNSTDDMKYNTTYWQLRVPASSYTFGQCNGSIVFSANAG